MPKLSSAICLIALALSPLHAQNPATEEAKLHQTVASLDTELFNAVNNCEMKKVESFWAEDALFLHDKAAPTNGREAIVRSIKENLCGKIRRQLVPGTLEVYPLKDYGAVEIGVHRFLHPYAQDHGAVGEAKFIHVWQLKNGTWRITQVISYDHHAANDSAK